MAQAGVLGIQYLFSAVKKRLLNEVVAVCYIAAMLDGLWELCLFLCCLGRLAICLQNCTAHLIMNALVGTNKPGAVLDGRIMRTCKVLYLFSGKLVLCKCSKPKKYSEVYSTNILGSHDKDVNA